MRANKMRTGLTLLGLIIGIMTVIVVFSAGEGIKGLLFSQLESFGTDTINTEIKVPNSQTGSASDSKSGTAMVAGVQVTTLTIDDMEAVDEIANIDSSYGAVLSQEAISYGNELRKAFVYGLSSSYIDIDKATTMRDGRFFSEAEDRSLASVVVLGSGIKEKLFGDSDAVGKTIRLRGNSFTVIGVVEERGSVMFMNFDDFVYMPVRTLQKKLMGIEHISYFISKMKDADQPEATVEEIEDLLRRRHEIPDPLRDDFNVTAMAEAAEILNTVTSAITFLLLAIVIISLVVGGVGIMNVMYVAVTERTMEIGLRKAVGASASNIMRQFLIEAILLTLVGGVIGCILGTGFSFMISIIAKAMGLNWVFSVPLKAFVIALSFSAFFGIVFGVTPARAAAKLDPIESLRAE